MLYELATLSCPLLAVDEVSRKADAWVRESQAAGTLVGCWKSELGALGRLLLLRSFDDPESLTGERRRALMSTKPFGGGDLVTRFEIESYAPFAFLPPVRTGARGGIYEIRTYLLRLGGLPPTLAGWEAALAPARPYTDHLVLNMFALDGPPRITHIWAFESLEQRAALRAQAYGAGVWPPQGGPEAILEATATIALPQPNSPLR